MEDDLNFLPNSCL